MAMIEKNMDVIKKDTFEMETDTSNMGMVENNMNIVKNDTLEIDMDTFQKDLVTFKKDLVPYREPADLTLLVQRATENLQELMLTINGIKSHDKDMTLNQNMMDEIVSALKEIDEERIHIHQAVEAETIKSSVLRHKLNQFPRNTELEIRAATKAVRDSNFATMQSYKDKIEQSIANQAQFKTVSEECNQENEILKVEKDKLREEYDDILMELNGKLLEKSNLQITLNDAKEKLKGIKASIKEYELSLVDLNEDMVTERQRSEWEQGQLKTKIDETVVKLNQQNKLNAEKQKKYDAIQEKQFEAELDLKTVNENIAAAQKKNDRLEKEFDDLSVILQNKLQENHELKTQRDLSREEVFSLKELHQKEKEKLEQDIESVISQLEVVKLEFETLSKKKVITEDVLEAEQHSAKQNEEDVEDSFKRLQQLKEELILESNECTRIKRVNGETQASIVKIQQEHMAEAEILAKEVENLQESLESEKRERQLLQEKRDAIIKEASEYVTEFNNFAIKKTQNINEGKSRYKEKTEEGKVLQKKLKDAEVLIRLKQKDLKDAKNMYISMQKDLKGKMKVLNNSISKLEAEYAEKFEKVETITPSFTELEETTAKKTGDFEQLKKIVVEMKTQKHDLEESVEDKQTKLNDMEIPKKRMINSINNCRQEYLTLLNNESSETIAIENSIYLTNQKLTAVEIQNEKFQKAIDYFKADIAYMDGKMKVMEDGKRNIDITTEEYQEWLEDQWRKHMELDKTYHDHDILLLDDIKRVEEMTSEREKRILQIHTELEHHLDTLSSFLENVSQIKEPANIVD